MKLHYIVSTSSYAKQYNLMQFPAANAKVNYIIACLKKLNIPVNIVATSATKERKLKIIPFIYNKKNNEVLLPSIGSRFKFIRALNRPLLFISLLYYLIHYVKKHDIILIYHSLLYMLPIKIIRSIKKIKIITEVEEIYSDVYNKPRNKEVKYLKKSDAYIISTISLKNDIDNTKPFIILNGTYKPETKIHFGFKDTKIHCVYAGTFDRIKGGAFAAIAAAEFLPENYHVHIIGFGKEKEKQDLLELIQKVQLKTKCTITYDGCLSGEEYIRFIQSCDIGLCTQNPDAKFNETSFPSKVLSYMANGLRVVSIRIKALELSAVNDLLFYYDDQTPQAIAQAIQKIDLSQPYDSRERIRRLDEKFQQDLNTLLRDIKG